MPPLSEGQPYRRNTVATTRAANGGAAVVVVTIVIDMMLRGGVDIDSARKDGRTSRIAMQEIEIPGYRSIARRDRGNSKKGGGVDIFVKKSFRDVCMIEISKTSERSWATLHTSLGPILIGIWYRPPDEDGTCFQSVRTEIERLRHDYIEVIVAGVMNNQHQK